MKRKIFFLTIIILVINYCTHRVTDNYAKEQLALYLISNQSSDELKSACLTDLGFMNTCIDKSRGIDPNIMCSDSQLSIFSLTDYHSLGNCINVVIRKSSCDKIEHKEYDARAGVGLFSADCQQEINGNKIIEYRYDQNAK